MFKYAYFLDQVRLSRDYVISTNETFFKTLRWWICGAVPKAGVVIDKFVTGILKLNINFKSTCFKKIWLQYETFQKHFLGFSAVILKNIDYWQFLFAGKTTRSYIICSQVYCTYCRLPCRVLSSIFPYLLTSFIFIYNHDSGIDRSSIRLL